MAPETLHPTPHGRWEKVYDVAGSYVGLVIVIAATTPLLEQLGLWLYVSVIIVTNIALQIALALLITPLRRKWEAQNAQKGIVECSIRPRSLPPGSSPPASSYKRGMLVGYARIEKRTLTFQSRTPFTGSPVGNPITFLDATPLDGGIRTPAVAPWYLGRGRAGVNLKTDRGVVEVGGSVDGLKAAGAYPTAEG